MEFCQECDNMLYTKVITEETKSGLVYYCLNCDQNYDNIKPKESWIYAQLLNEVLQSEVTSRLDNSKKLLT